MLAQSQIGRYLLDGGYLSADAFVDGSVRIVEVSRRNRNFKVFSDRGRSYLVKQGISQPGKMTVAHESGVYRRLDVMPGIDRFRPHLPAFHGYDDSQGILILELLEDAEDFREYHMRRGRFSTKIAAALGAALSALHRLPLPTEWKSTDYNLPVRIPWVLGIHQPGINIFRDTCAANMQLIRIIQSTPELVLMLDQLREGWRSNGLIHNDIKWDNCLAFPNLGSNREIRLKVVDWEFAGIGDTCWDAGAVFGNYLSSWLFSVPVSGDEPPDRFLDLAQYPLERMQPAIRAYWQAYVKGMELSRVDAEERLLRAVRYGAARIIQTGYEHMQHSMRLTGNLICLLQLAVNITQRPRDAIAHLLGIPLNA